MLPAETLRGQLVHFYWRRLHWVSHEADLLTHSRQISTHDSLVYSLIPDMWLQTLLLLLLPYFYLTPSLQGDNSPATVNFPDIFLTLCSTPTHAALSTSCIYYCHSVIPVHYKSQYIFYKNVQDDFLCSTILKTGNTRRTITVCWTLVEPRHEVSDKQFSLTRFFPRRPWQQINFHDISRFSRLVVTLSLLYCHMLLLTNGKEVQKISLNFIHRNDSYWTVYLC